MSEKHYVGDTDHLPRDGTRLLTEIDGMEIAVFRIDGEYHAVANFCVHASGPLCEGELRGDTKPSDDGWSWDYDDTEKYITCPWHAWKFDVTNGESVRSPSYKVPTYNVEVRDEEIYVHR